MNNAEDKKYMEHLANDTSHTRPSPETSKRLTTLEMDIKSINKEIQDINCKLDKLPTKECMEISNLKLIEEVMERTEKKFASKWTERLLIWAGIIIGSGCLGLLGGLIVEALKNSK